ncbi:NUDIX domain-containing protein [Alteriqipengyuania sp. NZ-12B]|uniref:NUDIX domain-containing protein n=1 Tax=Alteriqipengyuania abyssalis TaxID=2860200 RepID=A0ABS7PG17_9SPHN|nr:NUDIX domain-containing protein [Alteriqipengyuania abyssalis]MBY8338012.1 NUDIX domain-containing protein [Alteriqipengyuania abyssalis]
MPPLLPRSLHRLALRAAHRLRHVWRRLAKPQLRGVSVILRDPEGRVLFVRHTYGPPDWSLPGGGIARGEAPEAAARREMAEELGLTLGPVSELGTIHETISGAPHTAYLFLAEIAEAPVPDGREIVEVRFAMPDDPPQPVSGLAEARIAYLLKI